MVVVVVFSARIKLVACAVDAKIMRHLLRFRLDLGCTSASSTDDALSLAVVGGVAGGIARFVWCSARRHVESLEIRVVGVAQRVSLQVLLKRFHNFGFVESFVAERGSANDVHDEVSLTYDTYRFKPAFLARAVSSGLRCLVSHDEGAIFADAYYIDVVA